jgi:large subunit ribosomal protein L13Ae
MGRLASIVAKELLLGQKIVVVRCEKIRISGSLYRNFLKWKDFKKKKFSTNPRRGHFHERSPSNIFKRSVRGQMHYKTPRVALCFGRLKCVEGIPEQYEKKKRFVCHSALSVLHSKPSRKFCYLGALSKTIGWKYADVVEKLEKERKYRSSKYYAKKKVGMKLLKQAKDKVLKGNKDGYADIIKELKVLGY